MNVGRARKSKSLFLTMAAAATVLVLCCSCLKKEPPPPPEEPPPPPPIEHVVKYQGETLGLISYWYTGESVNWTQIVEANPGVVPERINLGDVIIIPRELVVREEPMPERVVRSTRRSQSTKKIPPEEQPSESVEQDAPSQQLEPGTSGISEEAGGVLTGEIDGDVPVAGQAENTAEETIQDSMEPGTDPAVVRDEPQAVEESPAEIAAEPPAVEPQKQVEKTRPTAEPFDEERERERLLDELLSQ